MKRLLFVAPAIPAPTGSGLRMRGFLFLKGLAREHRVTLVAGSPPFPDETLADVTRLGDLVEHAVVLRFRPWLDPGLVRSRLGAALSPPGHPRAAWAAPTAQMRRALSEVIQRRFDRVHVFRLYMLPMALELVAGSTPPPPLDLDLDDWESEERLTRGQPATASAWAALEREWLPRASRVLACSEHDAAGLRARYGLPAVEVVPNAVSVPPLCDATHTARPSCDPPELLFVGSLGHPPNQDALRFLVREVLPACERLGGPPFVLIVAGSGAPSGLRRLIQAQARARFVDGPSSVAPLYVRASVALAPLRSGGGTRIKALEAFALGRPLISTAAAVAGLGVVPGVHYQPAETAEEWAAAIGRLLTAPELGRRLVAEAHAWVRPRGIEAAIARVAALAAPTPEG